jgi:hypothetical protein
MKKSLSLENIGLVYPFCVHSNSLVSGGVSSRIPMNTKIQRFKSPVQNDIVTYALPPHTLNHL